MRFHPFLIFTAALPLAASNVGCGDELHNYGACVDIETARCKLRSRCDTGFDLETCVAYYEEFCRTRQIDTPPEGVPVDVDACVHAIGDLPCDAVGGGDETDGLAACEFLWWKSADDEDAGTEDAG